jgi:hypothetical protein
LEVDMSKKCTPLEEEGWAGKGGLRCMHLNMSIAIVLFILPCARQAGRTTCASSDGQFQRRRGRNMFPNVSIMAVTSQGSAEKTELPSARKGAPDVVDRVMCFYDTA